jgi:hypothetical protein
MQQQQLMLTWRTLKAASSRPPSSALQGTEEHSLQQITDHKTTQVTLVTPAAHHHELPPLQDIIHTSWALLYHGTTRQG